LICCAAFVGVSSEFRTFHFAWRAAAHQPTALAFARWLGVFFQMLVAL
jgi:hypothetical protein